MNPSEGQPNAFTERFAKSAESRIEADKIKNTHDNAVCLIKNSVDFFGRGDEEKKSEIATRVFNKFGRGYTDFKSIVDATKDSSKNQRIAFGDIASLTDSFYIAMNMMALGDNLVTDSMTAEQIDEVSPKQMAGIGQEIVKKRLMDHVKDELKSKNQEIESKRLFVARDSVGRSEVYKKWGEEIISLPEDSFIRRYVEVAMDVIKDLGVDEIKVAAADPQEVLNNATERISEAIEKMTEAVKVAQGGSKEASIPREREAQLAYVRDKLNFLENSTRHTRDVSIGQLAASIEGLVTSGELLPDVALEVKSRLKLIDCFVYMKKANGWIEAPKSGADPESPTVGAAATQAEANNHALDGESIKFFLQGVDLKKTVTGLPTPVAWDAYQYININYRYVLENEIPGVNGFKYDPGKKIDDRMIVGDPDLGDVYPTYWTDPDLNRKKKVDEWVCEKLVKNHGTSKEEAEKAWFLIKRLALASGENSIFNPKGDFGNDEMAEALYLGAFRRGRDLSGRSRGPQITLNDIPGIGNSWLRRKSEVKGVKNALFVKDIKFEKIGNGSYVEHFSPWWTGRVQPLRNLLLDREPDPKKIVSISFLQQAVVYFDKVAGGNEAESKKLRKSWVKGVLDLASSYENLGWTPAEYGNFKQYLEQVLSGQKGPFLTRQETNEIQEKFGSKKKMSQRETKKFFKDVLSSGIESMTGGGGKKKK